MTSRIHILGEERGNVIVIVAVSMSALILLVAFVVDVANWKVHSRHLQLQADAAALAAAHSFSAANCSDSKILADAHLYGGPDAGGQLALYNAQVGGTPASRMHILINSAKYYGDAGAGDNTDPNGSPCTSKYVDIKATETDLPWYFGGVVSKINAHARVSLVQQSAASGTLPIAVPNPKPKSAAAIFINEGTGDILGSPLSLTDLGPSGSLEVYGSGISGLPLVTVAPNTGVVIALSGKTNMSLTGTLTAICQQNLTDCYDAITDPPTKGISFIRGYSTGGSGEQPQEPKLRSVELFGTTCNAYFSDGTCTYELAARIDAGTALPKANQIYSANGVTLTSSADTNCAAVAGTDQCWHGNITLPANLGPQDISMTWEETSGCLDGPCSDNHSRQCSTSNGNKCKGTWTNVQRAFSTLDTRSGPIKAVDICTFDLDPSCTQVHDQSYPTGDQHRFAVTIAIGGILRNATSKTEPLVVLRIKSNTGQSLDCDPGYQNLKQELALGCRPTYLPNTGSPDCSTLGTSALWGSTQPWSCIAVNTGRTPNDITAGLNLRIHGDDKPTACELDGKNGHNNWWMFEPTDPLGDGSYGFNQGDPRILNAYLTTYGAFSHVNGTSGSVPVIGFGHFYVTGYTGQGGGFNNPCQASAPSNYSGPHPDNPVPNDDAGLIVGHFIYYLDKVGGDGSAPCDPNSINACVIVMTK